jgi:hypothetical protein
LAGHWWYPLSAEPSAIEVRGVSKVIAQLSHKPILARLGVLMGAIIVLAVVSMLTSVVIA